MHRVHLTAALASLEISPNIKDCLPTIQDLEGKINAYTAETRPYGEPDVTELESNLAECIHKLANNSRFSLTSSTPIAKTAGILSTTIGSTSSNNLPQISLPTFSGRILDWTEFWSLFSAILEYRQYQEAELLAMATTADKALVR